MCVWMTDRSGHHDELWIRVWIYVCSVPALVTHGSTVFVQFSLGGRSGPEPPSTHPEDFLFAQVRRGNLAQMWHQTKEKMQGLEVGLGPSFAWPQDLLLPGICLFFSFSPLFLMISPKFLSPGSSHFYSLKVRLFLTSQSGIIYLLCLSCPPLCTKW